jgi:hypothetical protein
MGPSEIQELLDFEPFTPLRLILSSGSVIELRQKEGVSVIGMTMTIVDQSVFGNGRVRLISVPNIALIEPLADGRSNRRVNEESE